MVQVEVLHTVKPPNDRTNPFVELHVTNLPESVHSHWFSWKHALFGRYDVIHFQWPENLLRASNAGKRLAKRAAFGAMLLRLRARRTPIVVTIHNLAPHEGPSRFERWALRDLHRRASSLVALNDTERLSGFGAAPVMVIAHGDYRQRYRKRDVRVAVPGRVVFFGSIRAYKNVPALIDAAAAVDGASVVIAGKPWNAEVGAEIERSAAGHDLVRLELRELGDDELVDEISRAELVALPYTTLYNSGAIFLALTLGVPVLAPSTASTRQIQQEVGEAWVLLYEDRLSSADVESALSVARRLREQGAPGPNLSQRNWVDLGRKYGSLYESLARRRARAKTDGRP
ncbi:hypothetical protein SK224_13520 [Microbacterium sp. BG28]|uniref:hypothetical protein n=1 Tax=Microbacterium sp. BG28 TaxID=3097356 RepID=UPI002A5B1104|nr:hypothetical protein [Microbacterium sp. BG28]MDY0830147.1 hypothetical protein [Microbacterium sp. BG28]